MLLNGVVGALMKVLIRLYNALLFLRGKTVREF